MIFYVVECFLWFAYLSLNAVWKKFAAVAYFNVVFIEQFVKFVVSRKVVTN